MTSDGMTIDGLGPGRDQPGPRTAGPDPTGPDPAAGAPRTPRPGTPSPGTSEARTSEAGTSEAGTSEAGTSEAGSGAAGTGARSREKLAEVGLSVKRLQVRHHRGIDAALAPLGVSLAQWDALRHLHENPTASLHDLAQLTFQTDQSFGALAARLIDRGLIARVPGPGRAVRHRLTDRGEQVRQAAQRIVDAALADSFTPLTDAELDTFRDYLIRLLARDRSPRTRPGSPGDDTVGHRP